MSEKIKNLDELEQLALSRPKQTSSPLNTPGRRAFWTRILWVIWIL